MTIESSKIVTLCRHLSKDFFFKDSSCNYLFYPHITFFVIIFVVILYFVIIIIIGKTTRPFRYNLNQNPYDYTVEVRNRFKGLDLKDRVPDELWTEVRDIVQDTGIKTIPMEKKCKMAV